MVATVLTREHALQLAAMRVVDRVELSERIRVQIRAWAREAAPLEPLEHGTIFDQLRALVNEVHAETRRDPRARRYFRDITARQRRRILARDSYTCQQCGFNPSSANRDSLTIDHIIPECEGGTSRDDNLQVLCQACNAAKGRSLPTLVAVG